MLVQVRYCQQQKYVKLDEDEGQFDFMQFHEKGLFLSIQWWINLLNVESFMRRNSVGLKGALRCILSFPIIERFCLPPHAKVVYKDATGTEVDEEIFSDLVSQGNVVLTVFSNDGEKCEGVNDMMSNGVNSILSQI